MKKIIKAIMLCCFVYSLFLTNIQSVQAEESNFKGEKTITYEMMASDVGNYCVGGRTTLEAAFRRFLPDNVSYDLSEKDGRINLTFTIKFDTYSEYVDAHRVMLGQEPQIAYNGQGKFVIVENFDTKDMLAGLNTYLAEHGICTEVEFGWLAVSRGIELNVNETRYEFDEKVSILEEFDFDKEIYFMRFAVDISKKDNTYIAYIDVVVNTELSAKNAASDYKRFIEKYANYVNADEVNKKNPTYMFELSSDSIENLYSDIRKYVGVYIAETQEYITTDENKARIMEKLVLCDDGVLKDVSVVQVVYKLLDDYSNIRAGNEETAVIVDRITMLKGKTLAYYEDVNAGIEEVNVVTYYNNDWGLYSRDIIFKIPNELYDVYDETIRKELEQHLKEGVSCFVSNDDIGHTYYKVSITKANEKQIKEFTESLLVGECDFKVNKAFLGLGMDKVTDKVTVLGKALTIAKPDNIVMSYISDAGEKKLENGISQYTVKHSKNQDMIAIGSIVLVVVIMVIYIVTIIKINKKSKKVKLVETEAIVGGQ